MKITVLFSGGLDSTTLVYHLLKEGHSLHLLSVYYGQKHARELESARDIAILLSLRHSQVNLFLQPCVIRSALTDSGIEIPLDCKSTDQVQKTTIVPNRNAILLSTAWAHALTHEHDAVAIAANQDDAVIYPDCRPGFLDNMQSVLRVGTESNLTLLHPFTSLTKTQVVEIATDLEVPIEKTWSCYSGGDTPCQRCGACLSRNRAIETVRANKK